MYVLGGMPPAAHPSGLSLHAAPNAFLGSWGCSEATSSRVMGLERKEEGLSLIYPFQFLETDLIARRQ